MVRRPHGVRVYGNFKYGEHAIVSGVYQTVHRGRKRWVQRIGYVVPNNPRSIPQQANRTKFADAVSAYQALTNEQKELLVWRARDRHMSGYNLFLREFMIG